MDIPTYQKKISAYVTGACVQMTVQLARDVGILDILFSAEQPLTSIEIAQQGKLKERYVREILGALTIAGIIQVDASSSKYCIPEQHKPVLRMVSTFGKAPNMMGLKMETMKDILTIDGPNGSPYTDSVFELLGELKTQTQDAIIDKDIIPCLADTVNQLEKGISVAEFGSGHGILILNLAARYPKSTFLGSDISETCMDAGRKLAAERGLTNITFEAYDLLELPESLNNNFDWVFLYDTLHDVPSPAKALQSVNRVLKSDGMASFIDFGMKGSLVDHVGEMHWAQMYTIGTFFCIPGSLVQREDAEAFGPCWSVETTRQLMNDCGFTIIDEIQSKRSPSIIHYVCELAGSPSPKL